MSVLTVAPKLVRSIHSRPPQIPTRNHNVTLQDSRQLRARACTISFKAMGAPSSLYMATPVLRRIGWQSSCRWRLVTESSLSIVPVTAGANGRSTATPASRFRRGYFMTRSANSVSIAPSSLVIRGARRWHSCMQSIIQTKSPAWWLSLQPPMKVMTVRF